MPYILYGLSKSAPVAGEPEKTKVATFSHEFLAKQYADYAETTTSKKQNHWGLNRKYYKWSLLRNYDSHFIDWEDDVEVPHNPVPENINTDLKTDLIGKRCFKCYTGRYKEISIFDDIDGNLHCDKCYHEVKRWF